MASGRRTRLHSAASAAVVVLCTSLVVGCTTDRTVGVAPGPPGTSALADPAALTPGNSVLSGVLGVDDGIELPTWFRDAIAEAAPGVGDQMAAARAYDAVVTVALAADTARSDAPGRIASNVVESTVTGPPCSTFRTCRKAALMTGDFNYDGVSGDLDMTADGDVSVGAFEQVVYDGLGNRLTTAYTLAVSETPKDAPPAVTADPLFGPPADGRLTIGTLLPRQPGGKDSAAAGALAGCVPP
ncbi:MAG: hypothetical protein R2698_03790 [Microthrixaceae bacterium]